MSLIHKALKKVEGETENAGNEEQRLPAEEFMGEKDGLRSQLTPRTIGLLVVAFISLGFAIYRWTSARKPAAKPAPISATQPKAPEMPGQAQMIMPNLMDIAQLDVEQLIAEGKRFYSAGKFDEALAKFLSASAKDPTNALAYNNLGLIYKKKGDVARAEGFYKQALSMKPDYPECLNNMGVLKAAQGDKLEAAVYLKKAVKLTPEYADAYFNLAVLNENEGNTKEAIRNYKSFLQFTDSSDSALLAKIKQRVEQLSE